VRICRCRVEFVPRDLWVGLFWDRKVDWRLHPHFGVQQRPTLHVYLCLLPCLPLHLAWATGDWENPPRSRPRWRNPDPLTA
jgi:hypothetical protein